MVKRIIKSILYIPCVAIVCIQMVYWVCVWILTDRTPPYSKKDIIDYLEEW